MLIRCLAFCFLALVSVTVSPQAYATDQHSWEAQWIVPNANSETNSWWCYRKQIELPQPDAECVARIACDSKYWLWINDELVVFEGQLKRGPTPEDTYYDEVNLNGKLRDGKNTIAILVWHFGREGMSHKNSGQVGLLFDAAIGGDTIASDATWRVLRHPAYGQTGKPHPNWRLPESNIGFDARLNIGRWQSPRYDDSHWPYAKEAGLPPAAPWNHLVKRPIPLMKDEGLFDYVNADELPKVSTGEPIVAKLPHNSQVTPYLDLEADAGKLIDLRTDNYRGGGEPGVRAEYTTRDGRQVYESLGWMNGHEVIYSLPTGIKINALRYRKTGYDTELAGSFKCDDPALNTLWKKAQRTLYLEMRDNFADCPGRERAQWWGDITLELQQAFYALDPRSSLLAKKAILELVDWQRPTGVLHAPVPAGNYDQELPIQMLTSVGRQGFWEYYRHTGDAETIERVYPAVKRYLSLWQLKDDGLVEQRPGDWTWGDWGDNKDMPLLYNAWYYLALDGQRKMAELVGDDAVLPQIQQDQEQLRKAFNAKFWTGSAYRSPSHPGPPDDRGNALAVVSGIAPAEHYPALRKVLTTQRHASPYMEKYVLEALILMGEREAALDRMRTRYRNMIDSRLTTLWEGWGIGPEGYGGGSYNHAWSGGPLTLLSQHYAGIDPIEPGYGRYRIAPRLASLRKISATVSSPKGPINVKAVKGDTGEVCYEFSLPDDALAELILPYQAGSSLVVNGKQVRLKTASQRDATHIKLTAIHDDWVTFEASAGQHRIKVIPK